MRTDFSDNTLTIYLEGRIDSNNANEVEAQIMESLKPEAAKVQFDAEKLAYISSAGLRILLKVRKKFKQPIPVLNVSNEVYEIFSITGFSELLDVHKKLREVSVEGCEVLGEGANGKVYRLTKDEMIKVFKHGVTLESIEAEREASRKAFLLGIPCAIAFDTVKCGESYGTVYEILNAATVAERILERPDRLPELATSSGRLLRQLHSTEVPEGQMPRASSQWHDKLNKISADFSPEELSQLHDIYNTIPEQNYFVHSDYHTKNVMESNGELMLIDLGDAGMGNPAIDLIHTYFVLNLVGVDLPDERLRGYVGMSYREIQEFWDILITEYFGGDRAKAQNLNEKIVPYSVLMYMSTAMAHPLMTPERRKLDADRLRREVLSRYDELVSYDWDKILAR